MELNTKTITKITRKISLSKNDIINDIRTDVEKLYGIDLDKISKISVSVRVPSGGDYSNMNLEIDNKTTIDVTIETEQVNQS